MAEPLRAEVVARLKEVGHDVREEAVRGKWFKRGVKPALMCYLQETYVPILHNGKTVFRCLSCPWTSHYHGALRLVEHKFLPKLYKVKEYLDWHGLAEELLPPDAQSCFDEIKKQRNMTRPCHTIAEKEVVLKHVYDGDRTAELAAKFQHFLPWSWRQGDCLADDAEIGKQGLPRVIDQAQAEKLHAVSIVCSAMAIQSATEEGAEKKTYDYRVSRTHWDGYQNVLFAIIKLYWFL